MTHISAGSGDVVALKAEVERLQVTNRQQARRIAGWFTGYLKPGTHYSVFLGVSVRAY